MIVRIGCSLGVSLMSCSFQQSIDALVKLAVAEDVGAGDLTTVACIPLELEAHAVIIPREPLVHMWS